MALPVNSTKYFINVNFSQTFFKQLKKGNTSYKANITLILTTFYETNITLIPKLKTSQERELKTNIHCE
jgi:hypothetical protein